MGEAIKCLVSGVIGGLIVCCFNLASHAASPEITSGTTTPHKAVTPSQKSALSSPKKHTVPLGYSYSGSGSDYYRLSSEIDDENRKIDQLSEKVDRNELEQRSQILNGGVTLDDLSNRVKEIEGTLNGSYKVVTGLKSRVETLESQVSDLEIKEHSRF